jgi:hypothetical protein
MQASACPCSPVKVRASPRVSGHILAGELHRAGDDYASYQEPFGPFILKKQKTALRFAGIFAPKSGFRSSSGIR